MNKIAATLSLLLFSIALVLAQVENVGIGTLAPDSSAKLELKSNQQGFLLPRMTSSERNEIPNPATGLLVYDTEKRSLYMYDGYRWFPFAYATDTKDLPPSERSTGSITTTTGYRVAMGEEGIVTSDGAGRVFFFDRDGGNLNEIQEIISTSANPVSGLFGQDVAIYGEYMAVGAPGGASDTGKVYIFKRNGDIWTQIQILKQATPIQGDGFGFSVAMDGSKLLVGAPFDDVFGSANEGTFSIFQESGGFYSGLYRVFQPGGSGFAPNDYFGWDVDIDGIYMLVGAPGHGSKEGKVYYYRLIDGNPIVLDYQEEANNFGISPNQFYGYSVGIDSTIAIVGYPGRASGQGGYHLKGNFFSAIFGDESPEFQQYNINGPSGSNNNNVFFGASVAIGPNLYTVGTPNKLHPLFSTQVNNINLSKTEVFLPEVNTSSSSLDLDLLQTWASPNRTINGMGISTAVWQGRVCAGHDEANKFFVKDFRED